MAGQSDPQLSLLSAPEVEFIAEDEMVEIVPNIKMESLNMICVILSISSSVFFVLDMQISIRSLNLWGSWWFRCASNDREILALFFPQIAAKVPLWLAVALKKRGKCTIRAPEWMSVDKLTPVLEAERETPREFQPLPFHYIEISKLLFDHAHDDIQDIYMVRSLIEDIRDVRFHKVESGLENISGRTHAVKLKNLSAMEVNIVRPFMMRTLQAFYKHDNPQIIQQHDIPGSKPPQVLTRSTRNLRPR